MQQPKKHVLLDANGMVVVVAFVQLEHIAVRLGQNHVRRVISNQMVVNF